MVDFKKKLADARAKAALDKQLAKVKKDTSPSMNVPWTPRKKKAEDEPLPPDLREFDLKPADKAKLVSKISEHNIITREQARLKKEKDELTKEIKPLCKIYGLSTFMVAGGRNSYYKTERSTISRELLLSRGVSPATIDAATVTTTSWAFRSGAMEEEEEL